MENCIVCALLLAGCLLSIEICASPCFTGTRAVTWTFYAEITKTWNEASQFCKERGGYLPLANTHITMAAFQIITNKGSSPFNLTKPIWTGLHSAVSGEIPNVWEANCCLLPPGVQYWLTSKGEPDHLDVERCCRIGNGKGLWRTAFCSKRRQIVCETDRGNCTYAALRDTTITTNPSASRADVRDVGACWSLCLELRHEGKECVAAVLEQATACKLYAGSSLLEEDQVQTSPQPGSVVMLRRCFLANMSQESFPDFTFTDASKSPAPAYGACLAEDTTAVGTTDFLSPGMEPGLVAMTTSPPPPPPPPYAAEEDAEPGTTTAQSVSTQTTTPSSTADVSTPETAATTTVEKSQTESGLMTTPSSTADVSTPEIAATTTVESETESGMMTTPSSTADVSTPEIAATTTVESETELGMMTTPSSTADVSTPEIAATTTVESETELGMMTTPSSTADVSTPETAATTTVESQTESGLMTTTTNTATSPATPPSTAVTTGATTSETPSAAAHVTPGDATTARAKVPKQRLCSCSCPSKRNPPRQHPANLLPAVIPLNATSKKRRSKTSVKTADASHSVVGAPWVVACVSVFCLLVLCDLNRFIKWRLGKCRARKNQVDPEP